MNLHGYKPKDIGNLGELVVSEYLRRRGFGIIARNMRTKFGELDIVASKEKCLHVIEVKSLVCKTFPKQHDDVYDPGENLHAHKLRKVVRMAEWFAARTGWVGELQVDGALVWLRESDGMARVRYYPQIL